MRRRAAKTVRFTASIARDGRRYVAQCLELDIASQGRSERECLRNLREALSLHFDQPSATILPEVRRLPQEPATPQTLIDVLCYLFMEHAAVVATRPGD